jgi:hypothetical protein
LAPSAALALSTSMHLPAIPVIVPVREPAD